ncbi:MAG: transposase [Acidobacteria bacterium]|nr:transposase [Acidobacteriota bacterium]
MRLARLEWIYKDYPIYYLTLVAHHRRPILANQTVHEAFITFAKRAVDHGVAVGRYTLMPDHMHLFAAFGQESISVSHWVKSLQNSLSKCLRTHGVPPPHFQKGFFDHVLRSEESHHSKWEYMRQNPVRAGLVQIAENWEFQGEMHPLDPEDGS